MWRRNRNDNDDDERDIVDYDEDTEKLPVFQVVDPEEEKNNVDDEIPIKHYSAPKPPKLSKSEIAKQMETFQKRPSLSQYGLYNYRMWLFDTDVLFTTVKLSKLAKGR